MLCLASTCCCHFLGESECRSRERSLFWSLHALQSSSVYPELLILLFMYLCFEHHHACFLHIPTSSYACQTNSKEIIDQIIIIAHSYNYENGVGKQEESSIRNCSPGVRCFDQIYSDLCRMYSNSDCRGEPCQARQKYECKLISMLSRSSSRTGAWASDTQEIDTAPHSSPCVRSDDRSN
jgi:hypothetical protein